MQPDITRHREPHMNYSDNRLTTRDTLLPKSLHVLAETYVRTPGSRDSNLQWFRRMESPLRSMLYSALMFSTSPAFHETPPIMIL